MKVQFLKDFLENKKGSVREVEKMLGRYLINVGAVKEYKKATKELKIKLTTK